MQCRQVGDLGFANELGNYAEYSGAPNEEETLQFARALIDVSSLLACPLRSNFEACRQLDQLKLQFGPELSLSHCSEYLFSLQRTFLSMF